MVTQVQILDEVDCILHGALEMYESSYFSFQQG